MSFSKAKLQRFNDIKPVTPSPAAYNPQLKEKAKCAVIPQTGRFVDRSPAPSEAGSTKSSPCFRTPTLPKRKIVKTTSTSQINLFPKHTTNHDSELLKEKIVECENKDQYIKELTDQMEEIKDKLLKLERQRKDMEKEKSIYEQKSNELIEIYENKNKLLVEEHLEKIEEITKEKMQKDAELENLQHLHEKLLKEQSELQDNFNLMHETLEKFDREISLKEHEIAYLDEKLAELESKHADEIALLKESHQKEIEDMEYEMLKVMSDVEKEKQNVAVKMKQLEDNMAQQVKDLTEKFNAEKKILMTQSETQLKQVEENCKDVNLLTEIQMKEKMDEVEKFWNSQLKQQEERSDAILKECQAISEYSIIQCELEKNEIKSQLNAETAEKNAIQEKYDEINSKFDELNSKYVTLQKDLSDVIVELNETRNNLSQVIEKQKDEIKQIVADKRAYQITMITCQETIEVLKKRLISSDNDVEQLKKEVSEYETKLLNCENKIIELNDNLKQAQEYNEELDLQYESTLVLKQKEIEYFKEDLLKKLEEYKTEAVQLSSKTHTDKELLEETLSQLKQQQQLTLEAHELISNVHEELDEITIENDEYRQKEKQWIVLQKDLEGKVTSKDKEIEDLKKSVAQIQEKCDEFCEYVDYYKTKVKEYESEIEDLAGIRKKYIDQSGKYDDILQKYEILQGENVKYKSKYNKQQQAYNELLKKMKALEMENEENKRKIEEQRILIGPFKEQLEAYEIEKDALLGENRLIEKEAKEISSKYAEILGHHNNKQKIKHLITLKEKNAELMQSKFDLEKKLNMQKKATEKLQKENDDLKKCLKKFKKVPNDKENIGSPNRSLNSSRLDSPGPLRERN